MRRRSQPSTLQGAISVTLMAFSSVVAGCGAMTQSGSAAQAASSPHVSASASQTVTTSGQPASGQVTLTLDRQGYGARDTIVVTVENALSQTIWATDHHTNCTVLVAERNQGGAWEAVETCHSLTPTSLEPLSPGATAIQLNSAGWPAGAYRITLTYNGGDEGMGGPGGLAHSVEFTIS